MSSLSTRALSECASSYHPSRANSRITYSISPKQPKPYSLKYSRYYDVTSSGGFRLESAAKLAAGHDLCRLSYDYFPRGRRVLVRLPVRRLIDLLLPGLWAMIPAIGGKSLKPSGNWTEGEWPHLYCEVNHLQVRPGGGKTLQVIHGIR